MLARKFEKQVKKTPGNIAVKEDTRTYTYLELNEYTNRIAHLVMEAGLGEIVGLLFDHGVHMIAAILGALKAGKAYVPLSVDYPLERLSYMLSHSQSSLILTNNPNQSLARQLAGKNNIPVVISMRPGKWIWMRIPHERYPGTNPLIYCTPPAPPVNPGGWRKPM